MQILDTLLSLLGAAILFGILIFVHEGGHFLAAKFSGIKVNEFAIGMGPTLLKWGKGETKYALRLFPIGGFVSMEGEDEESDDARAFEKAPVGNRILVVVAGALMNLLLGLIVLIIYTASGSAIPTLTVANFIDGATSCETGLEIGDTIKAVNGRRMYVIDDVLYELYRAKDGKADFTVEREGKSVELDDVTFETVYDEEYDVNQIVFDFRVKAADKTLGAVMRESLYETLSMMRLIYVSLFDLITGNAAINQLSGPLGIGSVLTNAIKAGIETLMYILAMLTINLGVCNILPLPALDGGRLVFLLFEAITRKKLNPKYEGYIHMAGFVLLIALMLFVTYNDVTRLFG